MSQSPKFIIGLGLIVAVISSAGCSKQNTATNADISSDEVTLTSLEKKTVLPPQEEAPKKETPQISDKELAALDQMVDGLVTTAKDGNAKANAKLQVLFAAADNSKRLAPMAEHAAQRVIDEAQGTDSAIFAQSYLILAKLRNDNSTNELFQDLAKFANDYPKSNRPMQLYRQLSDRLVARGDSKMAIGLLDHGIQQCANQRDVEPLKKQKRLTTQMVALMSRPNSTGKPPIRAKKSRTRRDSDYHSFVGKRLRPSGATLQGSSLTSHQLQGEWVYVHVWATWCGACRNDVPNVVSDKKRLAKYGVKFVGLNLDKDESAAKKYIKENRMDWPQVSRSTADSLTKKLGVKSIPVCFLVGPDGKIVEAGRSGDVASAARHHLK